MLEVSKSTSDHLVQEPEWPGTTRQHNSSRTESAVPLSWMHHLGPWPSILTLEEGEVQPEIGPEEPGWHHTHPGLPFLPPGESQAWATRAPTLQRETPATSRRLTKDTQWESGY